MKISLYIVFFSLFMTSLMASGKWSDGKPYAGEWSRGYVLSNLSIIGLGQYQLYTPSSFHRQRIKKIVVMLHGCISNPEEFLRSSRFDQKSEREGFAVLLPIQPKGSNLVNCWNWYAPLNFLKNLNPLFDLNEMDIVLKIMDQVQEELGVEERDTYGVGISAGGAMLSNLANCYPNRFSGVALHHTPMFLSTIYSWHSMYQLLLLAERGADISPEQAGRLGYGCALSGSAGGIQTPVPAIIFHGTKGQMNEKHAEEGAQEYYVFNDLLDNGVRDNSLGEFVSEFTTVQETYDYEVYTVTYNDRPFIVRYRIHELGHAWSGGDNNWNFNDPAGPSSTDAIVEFFMRHGL